MIWIGTSGYSYPEWKGSFYPADLPAAKMLSCYASHFPTVEINNTFYRMPTEKLLLGWDAETPQYFKLTLKSPRRITHDSGLRNCEELLSAFCRIAGTLGEKLGVLLFQCPPSLKKDVDLLHSFLSTMPPGVRAAFEFRHLSWHHDDVYAALKQRNAALCIADSEKMETPTIVTADFGYLRLRDEGYTESDIEQWASTIAQHQSAWKETFVYFKHEEEGKGPEFAKKLQQFLNVLP